MNTPARSRRGATLEDFLAIPEEERFHEFIDGEIVEKASPSGEHGSAQGNVLVSLGPPFGRRSGGSTPGGWWFATEVEVLLSDKPRRVVRPDVAGWRRDRHAGPPRGAVVTALPDWVCEVLSPSNQRHDQVKKKHVYHQAHVEHCWLLDPLARTLLVYRWHPEGYLEVLAAEAGDVVRAEPFGAVELAVSDLLGIEEEPPEPSTAP